MASVEINIDHEPHVDRLLYDYVKKDNVEFFKDCVPKHSEEKLVTPSGNSLLHVAVRNGSDNITAYLAEAFPSLITIRNSQEDTILHLAARERRVSRTIKSLVESNPILTKMRNRRGNTPLHDAVIKGNKEFAKFLVSRDPEVAYYNNKTGKCPLYLAVENGNENAILDDLLIMILEVSIPIGDSLPKGKSPVHAAIEQRNIGMLEKIEKAKPELLTLADEELGNSLHYASSIGFLEGVQFLLQKFPDGAYKRNREGNYPIHLACKNDCVALVKEFLNIFPDPKEFLNKKGQNILHVAAENGQVNITWYILKQDQKLVEPLLNEMDEDGNTPLHLATHHGQCIAAFVLVRDKRVETRILNDENLTPYDVAEQQSKKAVEQYEKTDAMLAEERKQFDSKNSIPVDRIQDGQVNSKDVKDRTKNHTTEVWTTSSQGKDNAVDSEKQDTKKALPKDCKLLNYHEAMITLSILYLYARPKRSLQKHFTSTQRKPPRKEETKTRIGNLLVVAVLVAGVTFAGAIQLPKLRDKNNSSEHHDEFSSTITASHYKIPAFESPTASSILNTYLFYDVLALSISLMASTILLWTNLNGVKFEPLAVWFSYVMIAESIYMMFMSFFYAVMIAVGGSYHFVFAIIIPLVWLLITHFLALVLIQGVLPSSVEQIIEGKLSHWAYYCVFILSYWWLYPIIYLYPKKERKYRG